MRHSVVCSSLFLFFSLAILSTTAANDKQTRFADYVTALENLEKKEFKEIIIDEVYNYLYQFPQATNRDTMHFKIASILLERDREVRSFFTLMEMLYFYPASPLLPEVKTKLNTLIVNDGKFRNLRDKMDSLLSPEIQSETNEGSHFAFIRDMFLLNFEPIRKLLIKSCDRFLQNYAQSHDSEAVLFWKAELLTRDDEPERALSQYMKVTYLYDASPYVTTSKLKMAEIFTDELDLHQKAIYTLEEFILEHPDDPQAPQAQFRIGKIIEEEKDTYLEAINAYTAVAEKYPESLEAVPGLFAAAQLYEDKFKEYDQAIRIYTEIVRDFPDDLKAPYAYVEAARIYEKRLDDYANAANVYFKVYGHYPESSIAPECLYAAAEINEKRLKETEKAITYYNFLVEHYPEHKLAEKARKRAKKLTEELQKDQN